MPELGMVRWAEMRMACWDSRDKRGRDRKREEGGVEGQEEEEEEKPGQGSARED